MHKHLQRTENWRMGSYAVGTDGTLDLGTASSATVTCTITGSFTSAPVIYTNCEGNFTSTASAVTGSGNTYTATITVRPTTAYAGDNMSGKLTVYCPYYGNTGIGQINLAATGSGELVLQSTSTEPMTILEKPANNATASITFRLEGEDAPPSSGLPVIIDNNYTLTDVQNVLTNDGTKDVETGNGFSASLDYAGTEGWITLGDCNYDAATKKFTQHFTLDDNTSTESPRTGAVVVFSPSRREVARFIIKQEPATPPTIIDATNLAVGQSANCYIISKPGRYELPAYKGVHKDLTIAPKCTGKPYEVWNDSGNTINFLQANFSDNKIIFEIVNGTSERVKNGNALIAIKDKNNNILWSWHLWLCDDATVNASGVGEVPSEQYPTGDYVHARNLGSFSNYGDDGGIYYQWSRKDPLKVANYTSVPTNLGGGDNATRNPGVFDTGWVAPTDAECKWSYADKSVNDPCPIGYKVPNPEIWSSPNPPKESGNYLLDRFHYADNPANVFFAYTGSLAEDGIKKDGSQGTGSNAGSAGNTLHFEYKDDNNRNITPIRFRAVKYDARDFIRDGNFWSTTSSSALNYGFVDKTFTINSAEYQTGVWEQKSFFGYKYWAVNWNGAWTYVTPNDAVLKNKLTELTEDVKTRQSIFGAFTGYTPVYGKTNKYSPVYGLQVRCVKE